MLTPWGLFSIAILACSLCFSVALPTVGNRDSSWTSSGETPANRNFGGINVPNPSISLGIPTLKEARAYLIGRFRNKQRRTPEVANIYPLPSTPTDAVQPQKVPVPDSAVNAINNVRESQNPNATDEPDEEVPAGELGYSSSSTANNVDEIIQSMATSSSASPSSLAYSKIDDSITSEDTDPKSLSHSLGTISHSRFEDEDRGKKKRDQQERQALEKYRKRTLNTTEDTFVPTIWNSNISVNDLDYWESHDLDTLLEIEDFIRRHRGQPRPSGSSSTAPPPASLPTMWPALAPSATNTDVTIPDNLTESIAFAPASPSAPVPLSSSAPVPSSSTAIVTSTSATPPVPSPPSKSLSQTFGLISHRLFRDRTHHGHKRNAIQYTTSGDGCSRAGREPASRLPLLLLSRQNDNQKGRREGGDDLPDDLGTVDISDEAYDEFRKKHPKFFGSGWKKERSISTLTRSGQSLEARHPVFPNWFAMLLSPSVFLEKRPIAPFSSLEKRDSSQGGSENDSLWVPDQVPDSSDIPLPNPKKRASSSLEISDTHMIEQRDALAQYKNGIANKDVKQEIPYRNEEQLKYYLNSHRSTGKPQTLVLPPGRRDNMFKYLSNVARDDPEPAKGISHSDEWFESAFSEAWDEEHARE